LARASTGIGVWLLLAAIIAGAYVFMLVLFGGPIIIINKLAGKRSDDEHGGKVFALSFLVGPFLGAPLMYAFDRELAGVGLVAGWVLSMFLLSRFLDRKD
jgi:hypothetical protein